MKRKPVPHHRFSVAQIITILKFLRNNPKEEPPAIQSRTPSLVGEVAKELKDLSLLEIDGERYKATTEQRFKIVELAMEEGASIQDVANTLTWKEFEGFVAEVFKQHSFEVEMNFVLKRPRAEIDVAACKGNYLIAADCKHWARPLTDAKLEKTVESQVERSLRLLRLPRYAGMLAYPVVVTLQPWMTPFYRSIPIVPIYQLNNFLLEFPSIRFYIRHLTIEKE